MNNKICIGVLFLLMLPGINALTIDLDVKPNFLSGETLYFDYNFLSTTDETILYTPIIDCPNAPHAFLEQKEIVVEANVRSRQTYYDIRIDESIEPQTCTASVRVLSPIQLRKEKTFTIDINPSFSFELNLCKDQSCIEKSKVFVQNENIYLDYDSEVSSPIVIATLIHPDKVTKKITLPISIKAEQIGNYNLEVSASKEGYKTLTKTTQFAVIGSETEIKEVSQCNANNKCEPNLKEDFAVCPQDCSSGSADDYCDGIEDNICDSDCFGETDADCKKKINIFAIVIGTVILVGLIIFGYFQVIKLRHQEKPSGTNNSGMLFGIKTYISTNLRKGYSKGQIKNALLKSGWKNQEVEDAFMKLRS